MFSRFTSTILLKNTFILDTNQVATLKREKMPETNGFFHCHSSCLSSFRRSHAEPSVPKSIWKSEVFECFLDEDIGNKIVEKGLCQSLTSLSEDFSSRLRNSNDLYENKTVHNNVMLSNLESCRYFSKLTFLKPKNPRLSVIVLNTEVRTDLVDYYHAFQSLVPKNADDIEDDAGDEDDNAENMEKVNETEAYLEHEAKTEDDMHWFHMILRFQHALKAANNNREVNISVIPRPSEFQEEAVEKFVPAWLFNFLAMVSNSSTNFATQRHSEYMFENPQLLQFDCDSYVPVDIHQKHKIISLAQDLLYLRAKGHRSTPKHVGLAIWLWHKFKSSLLIEHMHALGHCISYSSTMRTITLIATNEQSRRRVTPVGILNHVPFSCACDNLDFESETTDGSGQTHLLSSIFTQYPEDDTAVQAQDLSPVLVNPTRSRV